MLVSTDDSFLKQLLLYYLSNNNFYSIISYTFINWISLLFIFCLHHYNPDFKENVY